MMHNDDFDISGLKIDGPIEVGTLASKRRPRRADRFIMVPLEWAQRLRKARTVATQTTALHLLYRAFKDRRHTVKLANGLLALQGVTRGQKCRSLKELEALGLIEVEHRERKSPHITLLYPREGE